MLEKPFPTWLPHLPAHGAEKGPVQNYKYASGDLQALVSPCEDLLEVKPRCTTSTTTSLYLRCQHQQGSTNAQGPPRVSQVSSMPPVCVVVSLSLTMPLSSARASCWAVTSLWGCGGPAGPEPGKGTPGQGRNLLPEKKTGTAALMPLPK